MGLFAMQSESTAGGVTKPQHIAREYVQVVTKSALSYYSAYGSDMIGGLNEPCRNANQGYCLPGF